MVGMDLGAAPVADVVGLAVPGKQGVALLVLEDRQRTLAGGAVDPHSGHLQAPARSLGPHVGQAVEFGALEETLPDVGHAPFHLRLVLGVALPSRVGDEAPVLGVFQKAPGEHRIKGIGSHHCGGEIVDHQILGHSAEEGPGRLQTGDDVLQLLLVHGPEEAVAGMAQHDDHGPHCPASSRLWVGDHAQAAEVGLGHLARRCVFHADGGPASPAPVALDHEASQRRVGDRAASGGQQLVDAGHLQPVAGEPLVDLVGPRLQCILPGGVHLSRPRLADDCQQAQLLLIGRGSVLGDSHRPGRRQVLAHRIARETGSRGNLLGTGPRLPATDDFCYFHSGNLPVRHCSTSELKCGNGRRFGFQRGQRP